MTPRRALTAVAGVVCLALALLAALLARDVWRVDAALRAADSRARVSRIDPSAWSADTAIPFDLARILLGARDDLEFRALHARARRMTGRSAEDILDKPYLAMKAQLASASRSANRGRASRAAHLLGILALGEPDEPGKTSIERAIDEFTRAIALDPGNDVAKENLELMFLYAEDDDPDGSRRSTSGDAPGRGAGLQAPGRGY